MSEAKKVLSSW